MTDHEQNWTTVGAPYSTNPKYRSRILRDAKTLTWVDVSDGATHSLPMMPGEGIKAMIAQCHLPKVSKVGYGCVAFGGNQEDGFGDLGLYGVECHYRNGRAVVYAVDRGSDMLMVLSEFWPKVEVAS
ncbi:MAG: hypothetical protein V4472_25060 [Pseudomonadota bacterium]